MPRMLPVSESRHLQPRQPTFFFTKHTKEVVIFKSECALSLFPHDGTKRAALAEVAPGICGR